MLAYWCYSTTVWQFFFLRMEKSWHTILWLGLGEANQRHSRAAHSFAILGKKYCRLCLVQLQRAASMAGDFYSCFTDIGKRQTKQMDTFQLVLPSQVLFFIITSQPTVSKPHDPQNQHTEALSCLPLSTKTITVKCFPYFGGKKSKGTFLLYLHCIHVWQKKKNK